MRQESDMLQLQTKSVKESFVKLEFKQELIKNDGKEIYMKSTQKGEKTEEHPINIVGCIFIPASLLVRENICVLG